MSISSGKILVPIGFSEQSMIALGQAFNLAKIKKSEVVLLSVVEEQSMMQSLFLDDKSHELQLKVNQKLRAIGKEYSRDYGVNVESMVAKGKIYSQINKVAEMISADLIVMGTEGSAGTSRKRMGSNAERVVSLAHCPVITIKGKHHGEGCKNIILPLDLEKQTKEKVTYALEYARYWDATIRLVSVVLRDNKDVRIKLSKNIEQVKKIYF
jgi:nucleotide-binding universal stress UspA family protein